ncbi:Sigma factor RpoE negative regulatory protein RseB precursor, partial [hydrothermal vent metagenome]
GRTVEQVMFTAVEFPDRIDEAALLPDLGSQNYTWKHEPEQLPEPDNSSTDSRWKIFRVPEGFVLTDHGWHQLVSDEAGVEHWVYSDGLASISVYIEKARNGEKYGGMSHRGALNAYGTIVAGYYVTVVGEVPRETVEMIGRSVQIK